MMMCKNSLLLLGYVFNWDIGWHKGIIKTQELKQFWIVNLTGLKQYELMWNTIEIVFGLYNTTLGIMFRMGQEVEESNTLNWLSKERSRQ